MEIPNKDWNWPPNEILTNKELSGIWLFVLLYSKKDEVIRTLLERLWLKILSRLLILIFLFRKSNIDHMEREFIDGILCLFILFTRVYIPHCLVEITKNGLNI